MGFNWGTPNPWTPSVDIKDCLPQRPNSSRGICREDQSSRRLPLHRKCAKCGTQRAVHYFLSLPQTCRRRGWNRLGRDRGGSWENPGGSERRDIFCGSRQSPARGPEPSSSGRINARVVHHRAGNFVHRCAPSVTLVGETFERAGLAGLLARSDAVASRQAEHPKIAERDL